jgi:hypothetical protein
MNSDDKKTKILDIAMNLNRIGNWAADGYLERKKRIKLFLEQTTKEVDGLSLGSFSFPFKKTFERFLREYNRLEKEGKIKPKDELFWAEKMMTWGNILTHRARLIKP